VFVVYPEIRHVEFVFQSANGRAPGVVVRRCSYVPPSETTNLVAAFELTVDEFLSVPLIVTITLLAEIVSVLLLVKAPFTVSRIGLELDAPVVAKVIVPLFVTVPVDETIKSAVTPVAEVVLPIVSVIPEFTTNAPWMLSTVEVVIDLLTVIVVPAAPVGAPELATHVEPSYRSQFVDEVQVVVAVELVL
jgi:hypothetical protein